MLLIDLIPFLITAIKRLHNYTIRPLWHSPKFFLESDHKKTMVSCHIRFSNVPIVTCNYFGSHSTYHYGSPVWSANTVYHGRWLVLQSYGNSWCERMKPRNVHFTDLFHFWQQKNVPNPSQWGNIGLPGICSSIGEKADQNRGCAKTLHAQIIMYRAKIASLQTTSLKPCIYLLCKNSLISFCSLAAGFINLVHSNHKNNYNSDAIGPICDVNYL